MCLVYKEWATLFCCNFYFLDGNEKHAERTDHQEDSHGGTSYDRLYKFFNSQIGKSPCTKAKT